MSPIDISEALAGGLPHKIRRCRFGKLLDALPADQAAELTNRLHGTEWSGNALAKLISGTAFGHIAPSTVTDHRAGLCCCEHNAKAA